jgi:hypothetical protein
MSELNTFNQRFTTILKKFSANSQPTKAVVVEYYTSTLHASISMFVKKTGKTTLAKNYEEAMKVEKEMFTLAWNPRGEDNKILTSNKETFFSLLNL